MSKVWVQEVAPNNLHGFSLSQLRLNGLEPGINLIFASNAMGKSTLAKSILSLFQADDLDPSATVNGALFDGVAMQALSRRRKDAAFAGFPGRTRDYLLDLPSLIAGLDKDSGVESVLGKGFKLPEPVKQARGTLSEVTKANDRFRDFSARQKKKQDLLEQERRLPELKSKLKNAEQANVNVRLLQDLLKHLEASAKKIEIEAAIADLLESYPGLDRQGIQQRGELKSLEASLERCQKELHSVEREIGRFGVSTPPTRSVLPADEDRLNHLKNEISRTQAVLESLGAQKETAGQSLETESARLWRLSPADVENIVEPDRSLSESLTSIARQADEERRQRAEKEAITGALRRWNSAIESSSGDLERIERRLIDWFRVEPEESGGPVLLVVVGLGVCAILFALIPDLIVRVVALVIATVVAGVAASKMRSTTTITRPTLKDLPEEFALKEPTFEQVADRIALVATHRANQKVQENLQSVADSIAEPEGLVQRLVEEAGLICKNPYAIAEVVRTIEYIVESNRDLQLVEAEIGVQEAKLQGLTGSLREFYEEFGFSAREGLEREEAQSFNVWIEAHDRRSIARNDLEEAHNSLVHFLDDQGTPDAVMEDRLREFEDRVAPAQRLAAQRQELRDAENSLKLIRLEEDRLRTLIDLDTASPSEIQDQIEVQQSLAAGIEEVRRDYTSLQGAITEAEREHSLAEAEREYQVAVTQVERRWMETSREAVRFRITTEIRDRLTKEDLPPMLQRANEILDRFSLGRYRLEIGEQQDQQLANLAVFDRSLGRKQPFRELSTGTKVHCLLSLKISLIEAQEQNANAGTLRFPLIADEPFAVSDPESSEAVARALIEVATQRQVIIFTNQPSDVALLKSLIPGFEEKTLQQREIEFPLPISLPRTKLAAIGPQFDPRHQLGAQSVGALLGGDHPNAGERFDQADLEVFETLDEIKRNLDREYPRLKWEDCRDQKWAMTSFAPNLQKFLDDCFGCPHRFLKAVQGSRGTAYRKNHIDDAEQWLEENGYLTTRPQLETLESLLETALNESSGVELKAIIQAFANAYVPDFDPESWNYRSPIKKAPTKRAPKVSQDVGLFEELPT